MPCETCRPISVVTVHRCSSAARSLAMSVFSVAGSIALPDAIGESFVTDGMKDCNAASRLWASFAKPTERSCRASATACLPCMVKIPAPLTSSLGSVTPPGLSSSKWRSTKNCQSTVVVRSADNCILDRYTFDGDLVKIATGRAQRDEDHENAEHEHGQRCDRSRQEDPAAVFDPALLRSSRARVRSRGSIPSHRRPEATKKTFLPQRGPQLTPDRGYKRPNSATRRGSTSCQSPTMPASAASKIGARASWLIASTVRAARNPIGVVELAAGADAHEQARRDRPAGDARSGATRGANPRR